MLRGTKTRLGRSLPYFYGSLIIVGLLLIDWAGYDALLPDPAPYRYELIAEGNIQSFPSLLFPVPADAHVKQFEARLDVDNQPFANLFLVYEGAEISPILLDWQNLPSASGLVMATRTEELAQLAEAVMEHAQAGTLVLGWWDTVRQLSVLNEVDSLYEQNFSRPLFLPEAWRNDKEAIESLERIFWRISEEGEGEFGKIVDALATLDGSGVKILQSVAGEVPSLLVLQISDLYKLSLLRPELLQVGYQDFPNTGDIHDSILTVKQWLEKRGLSQYVVETMGPLGKRVYFIEDGQLPLLGRLLPIGDFDPFGIAGLKLVANYGSYWVYEILSEASQLEP